MAQRHLVSSEARLYEFDPPADADVAQTFVPEHAQYQGDVHLAPDSVQQDYQTIPSYDPFQEDLDLNGSPSTPPMDIDEFNNFLNDWADAVNALLPRGGDTKEEEPQRLSNVHGGQNMPDTAQVLGILVDKDFSTPRETPVGWDAWEQELVLRKIENSEAYWTMRWYCQRPNHPHERDRPRKLRLPEAQVLMNSILDESYRVFSDSTFFHPFLSQATPALVDIRLLENLWISILEILTVRTQYQKR